MSEVASWNYSMTVKLNVYKGFPKVSNKPKELVLTIYNESGFLFFFSLNKSSNRNWSKRKGNFPNLCYSEWAKIFQKIPKRKSNGLVRMPLLSINSL